MGFLRPRWIEQKQDLGLILITFRVDASEVPATASAKATDAANKAALPEGWNHAIVNKPATGRFVFSLSAPSARDIVIQGITIEGTTARLHGVTAIGKTGFEVQTYNSGGTLTDNDFFVTIGVFKTNKVY
jgi:hypothetical protein